MKEYFQELDFNYQNELREIIKTLTNNNNLKALELSQIYYEKLKEYVIKNPFRNESEEIYYFKFVKPKLLSQVILFKKIIQIETNFPIGSAEIKKEYYRAQLHKMNAYYEDHKEFINYYRSQKTSLDSNFFVRKNAILHKSLEMDITEVDYDQCTGYDLIIANFIALEKLEQYVRHQLLNVDSLDPLTMFSCMTDISDQALKPELKWSLSKIGLIEVLHIFKAAGAFNDGNADMKTIVKHFEYFLQIDLGDHYKGVNKIKDRKISKTKFMDDILEKFKKKLDEEDSF